MKKRYKYWAVILIIMIAAAAAGCSSPFSGQSNNFQEESEILEERLESAEDELERREEEYKELREEYQETKENKLYWQEKYRETREENGDSGETAPDSNNSGDTSRPGAGTNPNANGSVAYLTFDDGPSQNTLKILDILEKYGISATFFVTGNNHSGQSDIYQRILAEGHVLGNHTYTHNFHKIYQSPDTFMEDFLRLEQHIQNQTEITMDIMRFPGGSSSAMAQEVSEYNIIVEDLITKIENRGYDYFDWNVSTGDGSGDLSSKEIIDNALEGARRVEGDLVVLFHDSKNRHTTVEALPAVIEAYKDWGYQFGVLSQGAVEVKHR